MSADGDTVRVALPPLQTSPPVGPTTPAAQLRANAAHAALARLEAASTDWLALAGRCEKAEAQRDALAEALQKIVAYGVEPPTRPEAEIARAALAEAGPE